MPKVGQKKGIVIRIDPVTCEPTLVSGEGVVLCLVAFRSRDRSGPAKYPQDAVNFKLGTHRRDKPIRLYVPAAKAVKGARIETWVYKKHPQQICEVLEVLTPPSLQSLRRPQRMI